MYANFAMPCADPAGKRVYVVFLADTGLSLHWSDDDAATWPAASAFAFDPSLPIGEMPSCATHGSDVWVMYDLTTEMSTSNLTSPTQYALHVARSADTGKTFAQDVEVHDPLAGAEMMLGQIAVDPSNGALDLVYYAGNMHDDPTGSYRHARSTDAGKTFSPTKVVAQPLLFTQNRASSRWLGDYVGIAARGGKAYTTFADNSVGNSHVAFAPVGP